VPASEGPAVAAPAPAGAAGGLLAGAPAAGPVCVGAGASGLASGTRTVTGARPAGAGTLCTGAGLATEGTETGLAGAGFGLAFAFGLGFGGAGTTAITGAGPLVAGVETVAVDLPLLPPPSSSARLVSPTANAAAVSATTSHVDSFRMMNPFIHG
jgi:hypothetical protein